MQISLCLFLAFIVLGPSTLLLGVDNKIESLLENFEFYAEKQRTVWEVPGMSISIVKDDKVILSKGYGQRGIIDTRPVDENTLFQIGSLSKAFTSALVAIAADKGTLKWEDSVISHLSTFRMSDPWVTTEFQIQDLLAQRSGLPAYAGDTQAFLGFTKEDILQHLHIIKPASSFRAQYAYQNVFFLVAAKILELQSGLSYEALLKKNLFDPLKMNNTSATLEDYLNNNNRAQWLMRHDNGTTTHLKDDFPNNDWNYIFGPAGGINSTAADMAKWMLLQTNQGTFQGKTIISATNMNRMTRRMIYAGEVNNRSMYYTLGWVNMDYSPHPIIWHDGSTLGVYNVAAFIPKEKLGIVILTNTRNTKLALALAMQFFDMYFDKPDLNWSKQLLTKVQMSPQATIKATNPQPPMKLSAYAGTYQNPIYGNAEIKVVNDQLILEIGKNNLQLPLKAWDRDIFTLQWPYEEKETKVNFYADENNRMVKMRIELLAKEGAGDFERK